MKQLSLLIAVGLIISTTMAQAIDLSKAAKGSAALIAVILPMNLVYKYVQKTKKDKLKEMVFKTNSKEATLIELNTLSRLDAWNGLAADLGSSQFKLASLLAELMNNCEYCKRVYFRDEIQQASLNVIKYDACRVLLKEYPEAFSEVKRLKLLELDNHKKYFKV